VWGVLNVTPDSFSDGGEAMTLTAAVDKARRMLLEGADVIDVGGASSRPAGATYGAGAGDVTAEEERRRVQPVVEVLVKELGARVSIDTTKAEVAAAALEAGASIVNDVSCGASDSLLRVVAEHGAELVLMHNRGDGRLSGDNIHYRSVVEDVQSELSRAVFHAVAEGVPFSRVWVDPGIGFAKTAEQSLRLVSDLSKLATLGNRILVGPSRKSFIAVIEEAKGLPRSEPADRLGGTAAAVTLAVMNGAHAVRVHDVRVMRQAVLVAESIRSVARGAGLC
jgi:dihydropteroate synthase